jgi:6-phosphogluconolactonase
MSQQIDRRKVLKGLAVAPLVARIAMAEGYMRMADAGGRLMFLGTQTAASSKGIYAYDFDPATGDLKQLGLAAGVDNPTFLAFTPDRKYLYAANEVDEFQGGKTGGVSGFAVHGAKLTAINAVEAEGKGTTYVTVDHTGRAVFCANYTGGSASSFHIDGEGRLSTVVSHFQYAGHGPVPDRQEAPHAHRVTVSPENRYMLVNDLGLDCIHIYHLDAATAKLTPNDPPQWNAAPGSGPRALRFHPNGRWAYCVHELVSEVEVLGWDGHNGTLHPVQTVKIVPENYHGESTGCDIVLTRDGRFAYAPNRGYDCVNVFTVDPETGRLTFLERTGCGGKTPRDLTLDPTDGWLLVANQDSDTIAVFSLDKKTGKLAGEGKTYPVSKPQCLLFV